MGATLDALHRLQEIELQTAEIQRRIQRKVRICERQSQRIAEIDAKITAQKEQTHANQIESDRLDLEAKSNEAEIAKYRQALNTSKTNKEYSAVLTQLNTMKADNSKVEEQVLNLMNQIDMGKNEIESITQGREEEMSRLNELQEAVRQAEEKAKDRLESLRKEREQAAADVPPDALDMFNRVARKNDGEAMAKVVRTHPKRQEYACDGCNMAITIEQVNTILSRDEAVLCNVCGRILYMESYRASHAR